MKMSKRIIGFVEITENAVVTHRDSYFFRNLSVVSVRRPFFAPAVLLSGPLALFVIGFGDLLYGREIAAIVIAILLMVLVGAKLGQLQLLSRDLKNTDLSGAVWGEHSTLQVARAEVVHALQVFSSHRGGADS